MRQVGTNMASSLDSLMRDIVTLVKPDGRKFENIKASVQKVKIFIHSSTLPIEEGDLILRDLPNGLTERFQIIDTGFYKGQGGIPDNYQMTVRKETSIPSVQAQSVSNVFNLHGPNSRVNIQSQDSSVNTVGSIDNSVFNQIRDALQTGITDDNARAVVQAKVDELESAAGKPTFIDRYKDFMAVAADHMTVLAPFFPALAMMLH